MICLEQHRESRQYQYHLSGALCPSGLSSRHPPPKLLPSSVKADFLTCPTDTRPYGPS